MLLESFRSEVSTGCVCGEVDSNILRPGPSFICGVNDRRSRGKSEFHCVGL